ncbi:hypothetical protein V5N11_028508 [Cardamine amara subsp. amara]|uniref:Uncharacterized protein n=1 Tax=Cardamine amara subsp. amara TaxID=228776 RepID=A0ABD1BAH4_CARAN
MIAEDAISPTPVTLCFEADLITPTTFSSPTAELVTTNITSSFIFPTTLVTVSSPPQPDSLVNEDVQGSVSSGNHFAALDLRDYSEYEIGDFFVKSRGGKIIKPTQKAQENWTLVGKRGKRGGRGGRGSHNLPS